MKNMLQKLTHNSQKAIDEGVYKITEKLPKSKCNIIEDIRKNKHASLISEVKFSSPSHGNIRQISDPVEIAKLMIQGGAIGLSVLTQPHLFNGSPEYFQKIRSQFFQSDFLQNKGALAYQHIPVNNSLVLF